MLIGYNIGLDQDKLLKVVGIFFLSLMSEQTDMEKPILSDKRKEEVLRENAKKAEYPYEKPSLFKKVFYDVILFLLSRVLGCFFREIRSRGSFKVPTSGPVIFVAAPHANQFVDPVVLMSLVKSLSHRRISFLIAEKSLKHPAIGFLARSVMAIGVVRAQDNLSTAKGKISVDPNNSKKIIGHGTTFLSDVKAKGLIGLPKSLGHVEIQSVESDTELTLRKEFKMNKPEIKHLLTKGTSYKYAAKVDQSVVYHRVFEHLAHGECIGIFPEGGSHDRTDLLPLKAGVAIMALGCMAEHEGVNVKIVPCGMNYFHPHKFRSRAVVEFGDPIEVTPELIAKYKNPEKNREAVKELLDTISDGLQSVTVTSQDYETLMVVQAMRRLYSNQFDQKLPLPLIVEMNRRLVKGYETYKDEPEIIQLKADIMEYNAHLKQFSLPDHLVDRANINVTRNLTLLVLRSLRLLVMITLALPGIIMFSPVFLIAKKISQEKARTALAGSTVKIKANDVVATWKILMSMGVAPILYIFWSSLVTYYFREKNFSKITIFAISYVACVVVTYSALVVGDIGMDIFKSLKPLYISITTPQGLKRLQVERRTLSKRIIEVVNNFGTELFPDFDYNALSEEYRVDEEREESKNSELRRRRIVRKQKEKQRELEATNPRDDYEETQDSDAISLVNSDNSLSNIPIFSSAFGVSKSDNSSAYSLMPTTSNASESEEEEEIEIKPKSELSQKITATLFNKRKHEE